jgi:hypothetical protein
MIDDLVRCSICRRERLVEHSDETLQEWNGIVRQEALMVLSCGHRIARLTYPDSNELSPTVRDWLSKKDSLVKAGILKAEKEG